MPEIGEVVGDRYKILSEIGHGGMSIVYLAVNERANKMWAVKEVRRNSGIDFEAVKKGIYDEINVLKTLKHPHLPSIVDVIDGEESFLIVMDYIEGITLRKVIREGGPASFRQVIDWALQLCDVLEYIHTRKPPVIYRDLKPDNIMLRPDGSLMLIDFGTARIFKSENISDTVCLGTLGYAAPEQFPGGSQTDERTDVYGLGATMYFLATGHEPGLSPYDMNSMKRQCPDISDGFINIIMKCTMADPEDRYQNCAEIMYDLEHYEEIDSVYRTRQKNKLKAFFICCFITVLFSVCSIFSAYKTTGKASHLYESRMMEASTLTDYTQRAAVYKECLDIPDIDSKEGAYIGLIDTYRDNDLKLSSDEAMELKRIVAKHESYLKAHIDIYVDVCYEIGKLFWYYYDYGNSSDKSYVRAVSAMPWFEKVLQYAPDDYKYIGMSEVYENTGLFFQNIASDITEAQDRGDYALFFANLKQLIDSVGHDDKESDIVRLELFRLSQETLLQYMPGFKSDGIEEKSVNAMLNDIKTNTEGIITSADITGDMKTEVLSGIQSVENKMKLVYGS